MVCNLHSCMHPTLYEILPDYVVICNAPDYVVICNAPKCKVVFATSNMNW